MQKLSSPGVVGAHQAVRALPGAWQVRRYVRDVEDWYSGALALLPLSMMTAWRLHAFARMPGALDAVVNGTLCARTARAH